MAQRTKNDELNILEKFFSEMSLPQEEIDERIDKAKMLYEVFKKVFTIVNAELTINKGFDRDYLLEFLILEYGDIFLGTDKDEELTAYMIKNINCILDTTYSHVATQYYTSSERAVELAETETNDYMNYKKQAQAVKMGYTHKRWVAMLDERVRHTHIFADGQEVEINQPFVVGAYDMMFPLDGSLGAGAEEIVNCRCVCQYIK